MNESVRRFMSRYGKLSTKYCYLNRLDYHMRWLKESAGVTLSPDELISDNLSCVFKSPDPTEVKAKRRHTDLLSSCVNDYMVKRGYALNNRSGMASVMIEFYKANDSPLFGDFRVSNENPPDPPKPLLSEDIRAVLRDLPIQLRTPALCAWQSGCEVNRILALRWGQLGPLDQSPLKLEFVGRKHHRRPYFTFLGADSVKALRSWRGFWEELMGREPLAEDLVFLGKRGGPQSQGWLNYQLKRAAKRLVKQGLVKDGNPRSWHVHYLRHSFESEASHAEVKAEIRDFFEGHLGGIMWVYNQRAELHPDDLEREYLRLEPFVSMEFDETTVRREYETRERALRSEFEALRQDWERLRAKFLGRQTEHQSEPPRP